MRSGANLKKLEPFGVGNPTPVFVTRHAKLVQPAKILKEKHLKMRVVPGRENSGWRTAREVVGWRMAERSAQESLVLGRSGRPGIHGRVQQSSRFLAESSSRFPTFLVALRWQSLQI